MPANNFPPSPSPSPSSMASESFPVSIELKGSAFDRAAAKAPQVSTFLGRAGSASLEVLDILASSVAILFVPSNNGFLANSALRTKISFLAFEVANTIVKGSNLMQSLSDENIQILKNEILYSDGVQLLVSTDIDELLRIAAADKREELEIFSREVVRFGNMCSQWRNMDRFFESLRLDTGTNRQLREEVEMVMQELSSLAQLTAELCHEYHAWDRLEKLYRRKLEEAVSLHLPRKGESLMILQSELKHQRTLVRNLKKKSLWSRSFEEVVEKLVDVVTFIHQAIAEAFGENAAISTKNDEETNNKTERLGAVGLALHYANLITQMDNIASHPMSLQPNTRDALYNGLPASVKACLRSHLQSLHSKEVMTMPEIKAEMDKTLCWLAPLATHTTKAHHSFGWFSEWANTGFEIGKRTGSNNIIRLQTLDHADKHKVDQYILDLVILLHRLTSLVRYEENIDKHSPSPSPTSNGLTWVRNGQLQQAKISPLDINRLEEVTEPTMVVSRVVPGVSKSQEVMMSQKKKRAVVFALSRRTVY